jgi:cholesterol oxidase
MFDLRLMKDLSVLTAAGVGGGSLVYANVQLRAPAEVFDDPHWPAAIDRPALDYYDRSEEALLPRTTPLEPDLPKVRAFAAMGERAGRDAERLPLAVHFGEGRPHPFSGVYQHGCDNLGRCDLGCPLLAKNTVDITYIARAETHGTEVYPLHEATRIEPPQRPAAIGVWFRDLQYHVEGEVEAPVLVLAAGTVGSTRLLRRVAPARGLSAALGTRFSGNDALGWPWTLSLRRRRRAHRLRPVDDEPAGLRRARLHGRRRRPARDFGACSRSCAGSTR